MIDGQLYNYNGCLACAMGSCWGHTLTTTTGTYFAGACTGRHCAHDQLCMPTNNMTATWTFDVYPKCMGRHCAHDDLCIYPLGD